MRFFGRNRVALAACAALVAFSATAGMVGKAYAGDDDDEETFEQTVIRGFMRGLGLRDSQQRGIEYRERAPLVVPPSRDLPPPETISAAAREPGFPVDPEEKARSKRKSAPKKDLSTRLYEEARPLSPAELEKGRVAATNAKPTSSTDNPDPGRRLTAAEMGDKGTIFTDNIFTRAWSKVGPQKDEVGTFVREPTRESLIDPPSGYRTPSAAQPYGVVAEKDPNKKAQDFLRDRATGESQHPQ